MGKEYLGDGCYVDVEGDMLVLTTENGIETTNRVGLEPDVWRNLVRYRARREEEARYKSASPPAPDAPEGAGE